MDLKEAADYRMDCLRVKQRRDRLLVAVMAAGLILSLAGLTYTAFWK